MDDLEMQIEDPQETVETPQEPEEGSPAWAKTAVLEERRKRQGLEDQLNTALQRLAHLEGRNSATPRAAEPAEDPIPELDFGDLGGSIPAMVEALVNKRLSKRERERTEARMERTMRRKEASIELAREEHEDFDDVIKVWDDANNRGEAPTEKALNSPHPAEYAYRWAKKRINGSAQGSELEQLRKENAEMKAKLGLEDEPKKPPKQRPSNAAATGRGVKVQKDYDPDATLDDAFGGR